MTKYARNFDDISKYLQKSIKAPIEQFGEIVAEEWRQYIWKNWYAKYDPIEYERTGAFFLSIMKSKVKKINDGYQIKIYSDETVLSQLHPNAMNTKYSGDEVRWFIENIGDNLDFGAVGAGRDGIESVKYICNFIIDDFKKYMVTAFKSMGYKVNVL